MDEGGEEEDIEHVMGEGAVIVRGAPVIVGVGRDNVHLVILLVSKDLVALFVGAALKPLVLAWKLRRELRAHRLARSSTVVVRVVEEVLLIVVRGAIPVPVPAPHAAHGPMSASDAC